MGSSKQLVFYNSLYLLSSSTAARLLKFVLFFMSARFLSTQAFGFFYYTLGVLMMWFAVSDLGLTALFEKNFFKSKTPNVFIGNFVMLQTVLIVVSVILSGVGYFFLEQPETRQLYGILLIFVVISRYREFFCLIARSLHVSKYEGICSFVEGVVATAVGLGLLMLGGGLVSLAIAYAVGAGLGFLMLLFLLRRVIFPMPLSWKAVRDEKVISMTHYYLVIVSVCLKVGSSLDVVVLRWFWGDSVVAFYQVAKKLYEYILAIPSMVVSTIKPLLYKKYDNFQHLGRLLDRGEALIVVSTVPLLVIFFFTRDWILHTFFSTDYGPASGILAVFLIQVLLMPMIKLLNVTFITLDREDMNAWISIAILIGTAALTLLMVPFWGSLGAVWASVIARVIQTWVSLRFLRTAYGIRVHFTWQSAKQVLEDVMTYAKGKMAL